MRVFFTMVAFLATTLILAAQDNAQKIYDLAKQAAHFDYDELLEHAEKHLTEEEDIARFFYYWIGENIAYDHTAASLGFDKGVTATATDPVFVFAQRKATCLGFTNLYDSFLDYFGIIHKTVFGYSRQDGNILRQIRPVPDHTWSAIFLNNEWHLVDVTWANTIMYSPRLRDHYFMTEPKAFSNDHLPIKDEWFLTSEKISLIDFEKQPLIAPHYYGLAQKRLIMPSLKTDKTGEVLIEFNAIKGWNLRLQAVDGNNKKIKRLKYKKRTRGSIVQFTIKNYEAGTTLRLDAQHTGPNGQFSAYQGLAFIAHPDWDQRKNYPFRQYSTKQERYKK